MGCVFLKKIMLLFLLFIISIFFLYSKINNNKVNLEKADLNLEENELGVLFLNLDDSNSLVLSLNNTNILFLIDYNNSKNIKEILSKFNIVLDYIISIRDYNIDFENKIILSENLIINGIKFYNYDYLKIEYEDFDICINNNNCKYIYYTNKNIEILKNNKVLFFLEDIVLDENLYTKWLDLYKISKEEYTILKVKDNFNIYNIAR